MGMDSLALFLAFGVSLVSGYLGIGGGILMAPALLYLPPLAGLATLSMREVTGLTVTQGLLACLSGAWRHARYGSVDRRLVGWVGASLVTSAFAGSLLSLHVPERALEGTLAGLALLAAVLAARPAPDGEDAPVAGEFRVRRARSLFLGASIGFACGMLGQGGSFLLVPSMIAILGVPTRIAMGSNLALVFLSSLAGFIGKCATGQVPLAPAIAVAIGAVPGAQLGSLLSHRTRPRRLRLVLAFLVGGIAVLLGARALYPRR